MGWGGSRGEGKGTRHMWHAMMLGRQWTRTNKTVSHSFSQSADTGVSFWCRSFIQITVWPVHTVGCQSKSQGTRYRLGLIVYDIVAVKIFDRYRNIALSIRALNISSVDGTSNLNLTYSAVYKLTFLTLTLTLTFTSLKTLLVTTFLRHNIRELKIMISLCGNPTFFRCAF